MTTRAGTSIIVAVVMGLAASCAHRAQTGCRFMPDPALPSALWNLAFDCDDQSLARLREALSVRPETADLRVSVGERPAGRSFRRVCLSKADHPAQCAPSADEPARPISSVFVLLPGSCEGLQRRLDAQAGRPASDDPGALEQYRQRLLDSGLVKQADVARGLPDAEGRRPLVVSVTPTERACPVPVPARERVECPSRPACLHGERCVTRNDGCALCECEPPAATWSLIEFLFGLVRP